MKKARSGPVTVERRELAKLLGCSVRHVSDLEAEQVIVPLRRGRGGRASVYALEAVVPAYVQHATSAPASGAEREARRRRDLAQAKFTELKIEREQGALVDREDVIAAGKGQVKAWTAKLRALPRQMVQAGVIAREREGDAASLIQAVLTEISRWTVIVEVKLDADA